MRDHPPMPITPSLIRTVAAVISDDAGRVLLVRKQGSATFIQPGGKREAGEAALTTLARELQEELGVALVEGSAVRLGEFEADAVNEPAAACAARPTRCESTAFPSPRRRSPSWRGSRRRSPSPCRWRR